MVNVVTSLNDQSVTGHTRLRAITKSTELHCSSGELTFSVARATRTAVYRLHIKIRPCAVHLNDCFLIPIMSHAARPFLLWITQIGFACHSRRSCKLYLRKFRCQTINETLITQNKIKIPTSNLSWYIFMRPNTDITAIPHHRRSSSK